LSRVVIGHCGDSTDVEYLEELLSAGSTLGMDRFGVDVYCPEDKRVETVATLCERGWASQLVLSHDAACHVDWFDEELLRSVSPKWNFLHLTTKILPLLRERGVTEAQLDTMLVEVPRRLLDSRPGY
jgi:phosphotriesterase-related protein